MGEGVFCYPMCLPVSSNNRCGVCAVKAQPGSARQDAGRCVHTLPASHETYRFPLVWYPGDEKKTKT